MPPSGHRAPPTPPPRTIPPAADPTQYFALYPEAHILASSDQLAPTNPPGDPGLEQLDAIHAAMNIGLLFFRHSGGWVPPPRVCCVSLLFPGAGQGVGGGRGRVERPCGCLAGFVAP